MRYEWLLHLAGILIAIAVAGHEMGWW